MKKISSLLFILISCISILHANNTIRNWLWRVPYISGEYRIYTSTANYLYENPINTLNYTGDIDFSSATANFDVVNANQVIASTGSFTYFELTTVNVDTGTFSLIKAKDSNGLKIYEDSATQGIVITDNGNVGIGITNPGKKLQVGSNAIADSEGMIKLASRSGVGSTNRIWDIGVPETDADITGTGYSFIIDDTQLAGTEFMIKYGSGNVGIGTTSPTGDLHISRINDAIIVVEADRDNTGEQDNPRLEFSQDGGAVTGGIGYTDSSGIYIGELSNAMYIMNEYNSPLQLGTTSQARITITETGAVGIGITNPEEELHIYKNDFGRLTLERLDNTKETTIRFRSDGANKWFYGMDEAGGVGNSFEIFSYDISSFVLVISTNGLTGIGTTNPNSTLHINGSRAIGIHTVNSASYTLDDSAEFIAVDYTATGTVTLTLPLASTCVGRTYTIADTGANAGINAITINRAGSDTITTTTTGNTNIQITSNGGTIDIIAINATTWKVK
jgi:hypothetical protein